LHLHCFFSADIVISKSKGFGSKLKGKFRRHRSIENVFKDRENGENLLYMCIANLKHALLEIRSRFRPTAIFQQRAIEQESAL
jgi:hypothetical protein